MRRSLYAAALSLALLALPVWAQRHGGGGGAGHFAGRGGSVGHSSVGHSFVAHSSVGHSSGAFHGSGLARSGFGRGFGSHGRDGNRHHEHRGFYRGRGYYPYYPYGAYYPYGYYGWYNDPFFWDKEDENQDAYAAYQAPSYPASNGEDNGVQRDLDQLNGKIDRLQQDIESRNQPKDAEPETALVFRDQHVEEVRNYAIAGGTLWVLNDHQAGKKIPLAQLDIPATIKRNDERGVDFQVPR